MTGAIRQPQRRRPGLRHFAASEAMVSDLRPEEPVYCLRPEVLARTAAHFLDIFPGRVLYAVKANPLGPVLDQLYRAGVRHFDTASLPEVELVRRLLPGATSYFMHPVKSWSAIRRAYHDCGVRFFVVDSHDELDKVLGVLDGTGGDLVIMVRLATPDGSAVFNLSEKFGAPPELAAELLKTARDRGCGVGLCFHVGSQCTDPQAFRRALALSKGVIAAAAVAPAYLDVGGGFPTAEDGTPVPPLADFVQAIRDGLDDLRLPPGCEVMCEPGRALVAEGMSLVAQVQLRRDRQLYINDGIYGTLLGATIGVRFAARPIRPDGDFAAETGEFTIFGPTCDGLDVLPYPLVLPADIGAGDWIEVDSVGAYGPALRTGFNGFLPDTFVTVDAPFEAAWRNRAAAPRGRVRGAAS